MYNYLMKLVIQIPCHNEQESVLEVINSIPKKIKGIDEIIVTYSPDDLAEMQTELSGFDNVTFIEGGDTRTASVYHALKSAKSDIVLIHDGARPFVTRESIENCIQSVKAFGSGICAVPCADTIAVCENGIYSALSVFVCGIYYAGISRYLKDIYLTVFDIV